MMARIFVVWTILESRETYLHNKIAVTDDKIAVTDAEFHLRRPHAGQILAIFRIFGLDNEDSKTEDSQKGAASPSDSGGGTLGNVQRIMKSVVEIGTGERNQ
jgi:hypothetical protein